MYMYLICSQHNKNHYSDFKSLFLNVPFCLVFYTFLEFFKHLHDTQNFTKSH